jgi:hypothetical protein
VLELTIRLFSTQHAAKYVQLYQSNSFEETLKTKKYFELMAERLGVKISNYYTDNGQFVDNSFVQHSKIWGKDLPILVSISFPEQHC